MSLKAYRALNIIETHLYAALAKVVFLLMLCVLGSVVVQVFGRYAISTRDLFAFSILFTNELARYSMSRLRPPRGHAPLQTRA